MLAYNSSSMSKNGHDSDIYKTFIFPDVIQKKSIASLY